MAEPPTPTAPGSPEPRVGGWSRKNLGRQRRSALLDLSSGSQGNQLEDVQQIAETLCNSVSSSSVLQFCLFHDIVMNTWRDTWEGHLLLMK